MSALVSSISIYTFVCDYATIHRFPLERCASRQAESSSPTLGLHRSVSPCASRSPIRYCAMSVLSTLCAVWLWSPTRPPSPTSRATSPPSPLTSACARTSCAPPCTAHTNSRRTSPRRTRANSSATTWWTPSARAATCSARTNSPPTRRGDFITFRSVGAYGEVMASQYNLCRLPAAYFSDELASM